MQCRDARELLDSFLGQELLVETNHEVLRHLAGCPDCRADLEARSRVRAGLQRAFNGAVDLQMRPEFAAEVAARIRATPPVAHGRFRKRARWLALAASLLLAAAGLYSLLGPRIPPIARQAAGDHQNCAVQFHLAEQPISLAEAAARYDPAYARLQTTPPDVVETGAGTLHVADRHSCVFDERRFGHVIFRLDDHVVSVLMTADDSGDAPASADAAPLSWLPSIGGLSMASFQRPGHVVFIVSDLPDASFRQVAQSLADPTSRLAARMFQRPAHARE
jgi:anti-sigma factor RsiW